MLTVTIDPCRWRRLSKAEAHAHADRIQRRNLVLRLQVKRPAVSYCGACNGWHCPGVE